MRHSVDTVIPRLTAHKIWAEMGASKRLYSGTTTYSQAVQDSEICITMVNFDIFRKSELEETIHKIYR